MNQEKFGKVIKEIRTKNNLTQKEFAKKYNVTYQAVSKWENGINMPDSFLIKQISNDFDVSMEELFEGKIINKKKNFHLPTLIAVLLALILFVIIIVYNKSDFKFKTLSSSCNNFNISGTIAYNENKSAIYISNIEYCGGDDNNEYKTIECTLYESNGSLETKISSYQYKDKEEDIKLEDFLKDLTFSIDNHDKTCKEYSENSLYLLIFAINKEEKTTTYKIPLALNSCN